MGRFIAMDADGQVFRAVIVKKYWGSEPITVYEGPYDTIAAARARVTYWSNRLSDRDEDETDGSWSTGYVETGTVTWLGRDERNLRRS
ncbi:MAG: hypothetical protein EHM35_03535 [Planctomycetaceae bacterium]|nr:MAG: hypothetical protein EHM35_03535 [Planctomycetaceae bacterium]